MQQKPINIFVVDDDAMYCSVLAHFLSFNPDYNVKKFNTAKDFLSALHEKPEIATVDYNMPEMTGDVLLTTIKEQSPDTKVIMVSSQQDIKVAIDLFKKGAYDYIVKDADTQQRLWLCVQHLRETLSLKKEVESLKQQVEKKYDFQKAIVGNSPSIKDVFTLMAKAATTNITVSITGETGTGKDLVAKAIHFNCNRKKNPFVAVNVAAIPKDLLESELFGHEKGAFTGAAGRRIGKFEEAHKGTLFLDEIGEMDINMQAKLLRVLQEKELTRVGSNEIVKIDVRIIVATHRNLPELVKRGSFREDLYYRLLGLRVHLPPLRERANDILLIAKHFIDQFCVDNSFIKKSISMDTKKKLMLYSYPGNVRELKSIVELACVMADGDEISEEHVQLTNPSSNFIADNTENLSLKQYSIKLIQHYLEKYNNDVIEVAKRLDIGKSTIYRMISNNELTLNKKEKVSEY